MARCLRPLTIRRPGPGDAPHNLPRYGRENLRPYLDDTIVVPCGKCLACLKNKQSSMVVRCKREAEKRGSFGFMTLTYDEDHLPLTRSLFRVDKETGEESVYCAPEFISDGYHPNEDYLRVFKTIEPSSCPRCLSFDWFEDRQFVYQIRVTPSVCRLDVRMWLKQARIQYERDHGEKLPDFSYVAISEYGPRTCRPHYHLAFFGLQRPHLDWLLSRWRFGDVKQVKMVNHINADGSNGYARASQYIGKYMSKGKFECFSVTDGTAERPRVCQSLGFGSGDLEPVRRQVLAFDLFGEYDPDTLRLAGGAHLSRVQLDALVDEIPKRLTYLVCPESRDGEGKILQREVRLPLPRIIRDKIFKSRHKLRGRYAAYPVYTHGGDVALVTDIDMKTQDRYVTTSVALWSMVAAHLRDEYDAVHHRQYEEFLASHPERTAAENCLAFADFEAFAADVEEASMQEGFRSFYSKSLF